MVTKPPQIRAGNDAFGKDSPHWNLHFPVGNLTAAEILAYCPHWLKSVDVIDRFVSNGGKSKIISGMLSRFRHLPLLEISANSVCVMMQCAMRAAGYADWTTGDHSNVNDTRTTDWDTTDLEVSSFRAPHVTHPKKGSKKIENVPAEPIQFRDLARDVKEHPQGDDALDLTRCVLHAVANPTESWLFPDDFERLVKKLGGPQTPTHFHLDTQAFKRAVIELFPPGERKKLAVTPISKRVRFTTTITMVSTRKSDMRLAPPKATSSKLATSKKRGYEEVDDIDRRPSNPSGNPGGKRRSGRIATQGVKNLCEPDTDTGTPDPTPYYKDYESHVPFQKKRKSTRASSTDSDFITNHTSDSESLPEAHDNASDDFLSTKLSSRRPARASAQQSRRLTRKAIMKEMPKNLRLAKGKKSFTQIAVEATPSYGPTYDPAYGVSYGPAYGPAFGPSHHPAYVPASVPAHTSVPKQHPVPNYLIDPVLLDHAHTWEAHHPEPTLATAPIQNPARLAIDKYNIYLYAEDGCRTREEMWASAFSSTRFSGPRKHAPYRELYRLTDPMPWDSSDWAENVRWAKEQHAAFGVKSWTEYDDHLEQITQIRRTTMWVSEQAVSGDGLYY